jgi:dolichol-phosphate mannosyltransferase
MQKLSIILPIYNESPNISILFAALQKVLQPYQYEIIAVNDGSRDDSFEQLKKLCHENKNLKAINFKKNFGQSAAFNAGIHHASGDVLILMDSDLENDPQDIPALLAKIEEGYDVVSGWRQNRWKGQWLKRKLPSLIANKLISYISGVKLQDYGCMLKAYKKQVIKDVVLYGEMHRFIPVYCSWHGGRVTEIPVSYRPRQFGKSNYGVMRSYRVILDLILIKFLEKYLHRPIHFFGGIGIFSCLVAFMAGLLAFYYKFTGQKTLIETPLPTICAMFLTIGVQMILIGVIAELLMRTYYESQHKSPFSIKEKINF